MCAAPVARTWAQTLPERCRPLLPGHGAVGAQQAPEQQEGSQAGGQKDREGTRICMD